MSVDHLRYEVVELMPPVIEEGVTYISLDYFTATHRCCCGCGERVVTPISPTDWAVTFHGDIVSLQPSIGNWGLTCRSHYIVRRGRVVWAKSWSAERIEAARRADHAAKQRRFEPASAPTDSTLRAAPTPVDMPLPRRWWRRLRGNR